ncbi:MAG: hypothetical protein RLZZ416_364 [Candidatus Parcubacteria bacterium]|jgi:hypothetical protein
MKLIGKVGTSYQLLLLAVACTFALSLSVFPGSARADVVAVRTQQLLPPGSNTCPAVAVDGFRAYIYDSHLDGFEFTVHDPSYVAFIATVGDTSIPFQFLNRSFDSAGNLLVRVNMYSTPIRGTLPLTVTLLSAPGGGAPVCVSVVAMSVGSGAVQGTSAQKPYAPAPAPAAPAPSKPSTAQTPPSKSATPPSGASNPTSNPIPQQGSAGSWSPGMGMSTVTPGQTASGSASGIVQNPLANLCASAAAAYRLWLILLVVYALVVGIALWSEFPMSAPWAKTPERIATIILAGLLLLLAFWYFSPSCRAALWMPLLAFLIAVLGLLAAFWNHPRVTQLLLIEESVS